MFCSQPMNASNEALKSRDIARRRTETVFLRGIQAVVLIRVHDTGIE